MTELTSHERQFNDIVFPDELTEIRQRRDRAHDPRPLPDDDTVTGPSSTLGLVGLAFSGGGIRSASFSMGVAQYLIKHQLFPLVDYLSTVSGGGFTGACLSALMHRDRDGAQLLVDRERASEPPALNHVRNGSNYLLSAGLLNKIQLPAVVLTGAMRTLLLLLPPVVLAVFLTELFFELTGRFLQAAGSLVPIAGLIPLLLALALRPIISRARRKRPPDLPARDRAGRRLGGYALLAGCSLVAIPLLLLLGRLVVFSPATIYGWIRDAIADQIALGLGGWLFWSLVASVVLLVLAWRRFKTGVLVAGFAAAGPGALFLFYLLCCLYNINSPFVLGEPAIGLVIALQNDEPDGADTRVRDAAMKVLEDKRYTDADFYQVTSYDASLVVLDRAAGAPASWLPDGLTSNREPTLHLRLPSAQCLETENCILIVDELVMTQGHAEWWFYLLGLVLFLYDYAFVNLNRISIHGFYRDRLSRTFLIARGTTGLESADGLKLSQLGGDGSVAPYHLVNTALNLQGSDDPQLRERKTASFVLAKCHSGGQYSGHCPTDRLEALDSRLDLGTAVAISGAAAAPNMGAISVRSLAFVMTMLNVRLNYWLPNPARLDSWKHRLAWQPGLSNLVQEALGTPDYESPHVNCSDGGHIENLGVYELVRRRCRTIICVDAEADPNFSFEGFTTMQRQVEIDFGARIEIDLGAIMPRTTTGRRRQCAAKNESPRPATSGMHHAVGRIRYDDDEEGTLVYLKLSCTGDEPQYLKFYRKRHAAFPHEGTGDQFFGETQFEVYRALGEHVAEHAFTGRGGPRRARRREGSNTLNPRRGCPETPS